jgi:ankyrin repeat protein
MKLQISICCVGFYLAQLLGTTTSISASPSEGGPIATVALFDMIEKNDVERVQSLLRSGADPNQRMFSGWAPLHIAMYKDISICRLLLAYNADPNITVGPNKLGYSNNWTPIFFAVYLRKPHLVRLLLAHGASVHRRDSRGKTLIQLAVETKDEEIISLVQYAHSKREKGASKRPIQSSHRKIAPPEIGVKNREGK